MRNGKVLDGYTHRETVHWDRIVVKKKRI